MEPRADFVSRRSPGVLEATRPKAIVGFRGLGFRDLGILGIWGLGFMDSEVNDGVKVPGTTGCKRNTPQACGGEFAPSAELSEAADCLISRCSYTHPLNHPIP